MLSKPQNGWTNITIKDFESCAGYLVDIPFDWLRACLNGLTYKTPISLFVDEEGSECFINAYYNVTHIITDRDDIVTCITYRDIDYMDITYMIICDIKEYFEDWVKWSPYEDEEKDYQNRRKELNELIAGVEHVLMLEAYRCNKVLCISKSNIN